MLPTVISREVEEGIKSFLRTTFPPSTPAFEHTLETFLSEPRQVFKGPYYSLRLPFRPAPAVITVSDTTAITTLLKVGWVNLLATLFGRVLIPTAVAQELLQHHGATPSCCDVRGRVLAAWREKQIPSVRAFLDLLEERGNYCLSARAKAELLRVAGQA